jgi:hypothetical protein
MKKKKMAKGGDVHDNEQDAADKAAMAKVAMSRKDRMLMAMGGQIEDNYQSASTSASQAHMADPDNQAEPAGDAMHMCSGAGCAHPSHNAAAASEDARDLNQHGEIEEGPQGGAYAEGGQIEDNHQSEAHEEDMIGRIMKQRQQMYSEGGKVANADKEITGDMPNEFDDLHLRDDLESDSDGANNGDELGNAQEDKDRKDVVSRIMASRKKKDKLPNPR